MEVIQQQVMQGGLAAHNKSMYYCAALLTHSNLIMVVTEWNMEFCGM